VNCPYCKGKHKTKKALERIKEIEEKLKPYGSIPLTWQDIELLIKAFNVMFGIAVENRRDWAQDSMDASNNDRTNFISDTEAEFEERMNK